MAPNKNKRGHSPATPAVKSDLEAKVKSQDNSRKVGKRSFTRNEVKANHGATRTRRSDAAGVPPSEAKRSTRRISSPSSDSPSGKNIRNKKEVASRTGRDAGENCSPSLSSVKSSGIRPVMAKARTTRRAGSTSDRPTYDEYGVLRTNLDKTSAAFRQRLTSDTGQFQPGTGATIMGMKGHELTVEWARQNGLSTPIRFAASEKASLGLQTPPEVTPHVVATLVGASRKVVAMDVANQRSNCTFTLQGWADNWVQKPRTRVLNMISLEFSGTPLAAQVRSPSFVREVDWVGRTFPIRSTTPAVAGKSRANKKNADSTDIATESSSIDTSASTASSSSSSISTSSSGSTTVYGHKGFGSTTRPKVQYYCLMSMAQSYTDFHVDFGGTSVWYHLVSGQKVFLLAPPTPIVLSAFNDFTFDSSAFLPDLLPPCTFTRVELRAGETLLIPAGWVHAVLTPSDSVVFGGNFLHSFGIKEQAEIMEQEVSTSVAPSMRFPLAHELCWRVVVQYAALVLQQQRRRSSTSNAPHSTHGMSNGNQDGDSNDTMNDDAVWTRGLTGSECREVRTHLVQRCLASKQLFLNVTPSWVEDSPKLIDWLKGILSEVETDTNREVVSSTNGKKSENSALSRTGRNTRGAKRSRRHDKDNTPVDAPVEDLFPGVNMKQLRSFLPPDLLPVPAPSLCTADMESKDDAGEEQLECPVIEEWFNRAYEAAAAKSQGSSNAAQYDDKNNCSADNEDNVDDDAARQARDEFERLTSGDPASKPVDSSTPTVDTAKMLHAARTTRGKSGAPKKESGSSKTGKGGGSKSANSSGKVPASLLPEESLPATGLLPVGTIVKARFKRSQKWYSGTVVGVANSTGAQIAHVTNAVDAEHAYNVGVAAVEEPNTMATNEVHGAAESNESVATSNSKTVPPIIHKNEVIKGFVAGSIPMESSSSTVSHEEQKQQHQQSDPLASLSSVPLHMLHKAAVIAASKVAYQVCFEDGDYDPACKRDCVKGPPLDSRSWPTARARALRTLAAFQQALSVWELAQTKAERLAKKRTREEANAEEAAAAALDTSIWPFEFPSQSAELSGVKRSRARLAIAPARLSLSDTLNEATANKTAMSPANKQSRLGAAVSSAQVDALQAPSQFRKQRQQQSMELPGVKKMRAYAAIAPARLALSALLQEATKNQTAPAVSTASIAFNLAPGSISNPFLARSPSLLSPMPRLAAMPQQGPQYTAAVAARDLKSSPESKQVKSWSRKSSSVSARELAAIAREPVDPTIAHALANSLEHTAAVSKATAEEARALAARISSNAPQLRLPQGALLTYDPANATISDATASTSRNHSFRSRERPTAALSSGSSPAAIEALLAPQAPELAVKAHARK